MPDADDYDSMVANAFRRASWRVLRPRAAEAPKLIAEHRGRKYFVEIKRSSESRPDRLVPLLSQAILQAQTYARQQPQGVPVAVVAARRVPAPVAESIRQFAKRFAPDAAVGVVDSHGLRAFTGHGLEVLNANPPATARSTRAPLRGTAPNLFSDLNQWMLKTLLAPRIDMDLLHAPRLRIRNASELARVAGVSVMTAFRLVRQLGEETFLAERSEFLEPVRIPELLARWAAARQPAQEFPVRWIVRKDPDRLPLALKSYAADIVRSRPGRRGAAKPTRACLGLFAAAEALGFGFVRGVPPHIYLEREDLGLLRRLGLSAEGADAGPDAYVRIPSNPECIFRAAVLAEGIPCSDILQIWLDVSGHPSRGSAQAKEIRRGPLAGLFRKK